MNKEKLKSINYWMRHYQLFNLDEQWLIDHIKDIVDSKDWHCLIDHQDDGLLHERQLAFLINKRGHVPKLYQTKEGDPK